MFLFWFLIWYSMWRHYFAVATDTITSCSLGRRYGPVFSLSFLDVYVYCAKTCVFIRLYRHLWCNSMCLIHAWSFACMHPLYLVMISVVGAYSYRILSSVVRTFLHWKWCWNIPCALYIEGSYERGFRWLLWWTNLH
jgi:hypothetical protein